jgi:hypothetical protein
MLSNLVWMHWQLNLMYQTRHYSSQIDYATCLNTIEWDYLTASLLKALSNYRYFIVFLKTQLWYNSDLFRFKEELLMLILIIFDEG